jgi:RimJ/RimL family protein N-acetyltransferase
MSLSDDPELISTMGWRPFQNNNERERKRFLNAIETLTIPYSGDCGEGHGEDQAITFSIITRKDDLPIGYVTLKSIDHDKRRRAELGIAIMESQYRFGGYGSDALRLAIDYAFNTLQLISIELTVFISNTKAIRLYEKMGFGVVDILQKAWTMPDGERVDMLLMELKKSPFDE